MFRNIVIVSMLVAVSLVVSHWICAQLYTTYCAPSGIWGFLSTSLTMGSPVCSTLVYALAKTSEFYAVLWIGSLTAVCSMLVKIVNTNTGIHYGGQDVQGGGQVAH